MPQSTCKNNTIYFEGSGGGNREERLGNQYLTRQASGSISTALTNC